VSGDTQWLRGLNRLVLLLVLASFPLWVGASDMPYLEALQRGDVLAAQGERAAAVAAYLQAAKILPHKPDAYLRLARAYLEWGRTPAAERALSQAEAAGANEHDVVRLRVVTAGQQGKWATVVRLAVVLLEQLPNDRSLRHTLADAYLEQRAWEAARIQYETLVGQYPEDALAQERLGILTLGELDAPQHLALSGTELAARILEALTDPDAAQDPAYSHLLVGRALLDAGEWPLAAYEFERVRRADPGRADAYAYLGHALDQMGHFDNALMVLRQAVQMAPDSALAHILLGLHFDMLGDLRAARAEYKIGYDLDPENPAVCIEIGATWAAEGQHTVAEVWYQEAVRLEPGDAALWQALASFYLDYGIDVAGEGFMAASRAVELDPENPEAFVLLGRAAFEAGDYGVAEDTLLKALELDPNRVSANYHLGQVLQARGDWVGGEAAFARALDLDVAGWYCFLLSRAMDREPVPGAFDCR